MTTTFKIHSYPPRLGQATHRHNGAHLSLLLKGMVEEESGGNEEHATTGMFAIREAGFAHQVRFGESGALILSLAVSGDQFQGLEPGDVGRWRQGSDGLVEAVLASAMRQERGSDLEDSVWDLVAGPCHRREPAAARWLLRARDRLTEERTPIGELAAEAGVHRVHLSRAFARAFGMPPTMYRRRMSGMRAAAAAIRGERAAVTAYQCGFADQSHMARVLRQVTGTSYNRLRTLRGEVTSVQE